MEPMEPMERVYKIDNISFTAHNITSDMVYTQHKLLYNVPYGSIGCLT